MCQIKMDLGQNTATWQFIASRIQSHISPPAHERELASQAHTPWALTARSTPLQ